MNNREAYLISLMQRMRLSSSLPENGLRNLNQLSDTAPNNQYYNENNYGQVVNNMRINNFCLHNPNSSSRINSNFQIQSVTRQSPTSNAINGDSINNVTKSSMILQYFFAKPYDAMTKIQTSHEFKMSLKTYDRSVINAILNKIIEYPPLLLIVTSCHSHGFQVIKELIHVSKKLPRIIELVKIFAPRLLDVMNYQYGRHVIEQCFKQLDFYKSMPLYQEVLKNWWPLAINKYGCIALNTCIASMVLSPSLRYVYDIQLLPDIAINAKVLALDQYGIFVLQHVLPTYNNAYDELIVEELKPLYKVLCTSQSGSFLVERYIATPFRSIVAEELLKINCLVKIALDEFGNYTIQKLLIETKKHDASLYERLRNILLEELISLECSPYGRNIAKILKDDEGKVEECCYNNLCGYQLL